MTATIAPPVLPTESGDSERLLPIGVNLLPEEVVTTRAARNARRSALVVMTVVAVAVGAWYYTASSSADDVRSQLGAASAATAARAGDQRKFADLTNTKASIASTRGKIITATKGNVAWNSVLKRVRSALPAKVVLTGVTATATSSTQVPAAAAGTSEGATSGSGSTASSGTTDTAPGTLLITGGAPTKDLVSAFANNLAKQTGLADPFVTGVQHGTEDRGVTFSVQVVVTNHSLSTRYDPKAGK